MKNITKQTTLKPINWEKINSYEEVTKIMYPDGFNTQEQHGLWKLKTKLHKEEWNKIKHLFHFYKKDNTTIKNSKYYGWATVKPVEVMKIIYTIRNT